MPLCNFIGTPNSEKKRASDFFFFNFFFFSAMDSGLVKKAKDLLGHHAFGNDSVKGVSQDYNKPLFVPAFSDSFQAIMGQDVGGRISLDMWKHQYTTHFPQTVRIFKVVKK